MLCHFGIREVIYPIHDIYDGASGLDTLAEMCSFDFREDTWLEAGHGSLMGTHELLPASKSENALRRDMNGNKHKEPGMSCFFLKGNPVEPYKVGYN